MWLSGLLFSRYDGLYNFAVVEPGVLLRCGQPRTRDLEHIRQKHGLRTIVCARGGTRHPLRGWWFRRERAYCARHGIHLEHIPFSDAQVPPADVFDRFIELVRRPENQPLLVHCEQGYHRTGILCAAYRVALGGWPLPRALDEMRDAGFELRHGKRRPLYDALCTWAAARAEGAARD
ncbi:MAG: tyrosine-protein phosphatase [Planctomycetes bacterium]|nr:tyrosine-protein phosphatase [Planctomycetota bacterium]